MNKKSIITVAIIAGVIILAVILYFITRPNDQKTTENVGGNITFDKTSFQWGEISAAKGEVKTQFKIRNDSNEVLELGEMKTSCGCTTANYIINGERSMAFGMHTKAEKWSQKLNPQEEAIVEVIFDPNFHKGQRGPIMRDVSISSSDPDLSVATLRLTGTVMD